MRARARPRSREVFIAPRGPAAYPVPFHSLYRRAFGRDSERLPTGSGILIRWPCKGGCPLIPGRWLLFSPFIYFRGIYPVSLSLSSLLRGLFASFVRVYASCCMRSLATFTFAAFLAAITIGLGWNWFCAWMKPWVWFLRCAVWPGREWNGRLQKLTQGGFRWFDCFGGVVFGEDKLCSFFAFFYITRIKEKRIEKLLEKIIRSNLLKSWSILRVSISSFFFFLFWIARSLYANLQVDFIFFWNRIRESLRRFKIDV